MKKTHSTLVALLIVCSIGAQPDFLTPEFPTFASSLSEFVPKEWIATDTAYGDINHDNVQDAIFIIETQHEVKDLNSSKIKPRILLILLGTKGQYFLRAQSHTAVVPGGNSELEWYKNVEVNNGKVVITHGCINCWAIHTYAFQNGDFYLVHASNGGKNASQSFQYDYDCNSGNLTLNETYTDNPQKNLKETTQQRISKIPLLIDFKPWSLSLQNGKFNL